MRSKALQIVMDIAFIYAIMYCSSQFDEAVSKEAIEAYQAEEGLQQESEAEKPTDGMEKLKAGIIRSAPVLGIQPELMLGKCPTASLDDIKNALTIAGAGLLATSKAWMGDDVKGAVWMVVLLTRATVVDAQAIPHYSCVALVEDLPNPGCLLAFEKVGHLQLCDEMAAERDNLCRKRSPLCKARHREHVEACQHSRASFLWLQGSPMLLQTGADFDAVSTGVNFAKGRPTLQISTSWPSANAVDGAMETPATRAKTCSLTKHSGTLEADPWWQVDLQAERSVASVRLTGMSELRASFVLLDILIEGSNGEWKQCGDSVSMVRGLTIDTQCSPTLIGSKLKVVQKLKGSFLSLCEVEVFGPFERNAPCYDGSRYASEACLTCTGPGPSQCLTCALEHALVPFRGSSTSSFEGHCRKFGASVQVQVNPGPVSPEKSLLPTYLSKWGTGGEVTARTAAQGLGVEQVWIQVACHIQKNEYCSGRQSVDENQACNVTKLARLHRVERITYAEHHLIHAKIVKIGGKCDGSKARGDDSWVTPCDEAIKLPKLCCANFFACCNPPLTAIADLVDLQGLPPESLCDGVVKLL